MEFPAPSPSSLLSAGTRQWEAGEATSLEMTKNSMVKLAKLAMVQRCNGATPWYLLQMTRNWSIFVKLGQCPRSD
jgi:hypothetical protein